MTGDLQTDEQQFVQLFEKKRLKKTFKTLRREFRSLRSRDVIDWTDWFVELDESLEQLRNEILSGQYAPSNVTRYELGKAKGAFRVITAFNIKDALVYRHICDEVLARANPYKVPGAFFSRRQTLTPVGQTFDIADHDYHEFFAIWLRYNEYRKITALNSAYNNVVVSDITNYFDSIQHELLLEYISPFGLPQKMIGLLGKMLETFKPQSGHSPTPRVGLPVDELDCSRQLAHVFLFDHDRRMVQRYGADNYIRWMDDQTIGTDSAADARQCVNLLNHSLNAQRLTLNAGKTRFLSPKDVPMYFQLEANERINDWECEFRNHEKVDMAQGRIQLEKLWSHITGLAGSESGMWDKVLKRLYGCAAVADSPILEQRALEDLIQNPDLDVRIFEYFARRNRTDELINLFESYCARKENLFEATEAAFLEAISTVDANNKTEKRILAITEKIAIGEFPGACGKPMGRSAAILALYWFGFSETMMTSLFSETQARSLPKEAARTWLAVCAALNPATLSTINAKLFGHVSDDVARLYRFLASIIDGKVQTLGQYRNVRSRGLLRQQYYDSRSWLLLELASLSSNSTLKFTSRSNVALFKATAKSEAELRVLDRIKRRL